MIIPESIFNDLPDQGNQSTEEAVRKAWVRESRFGRWFLTSKTWKRYVLSPAVGSLKGLLGDSHYGTDKILDAGCGRGLAFSLLEEHFQPKTLIGVDIDREEIAYASAAGDRCRCEVLLAPATITHLSLASDSVDIIFCHQLLHHVAGQEQVLAELHRVLKPGGVLLLGESCRSFISTFVVRHFFKHPDGVQKSPGQYVALVRSLGFEVDDDDVQISRPFWSRPDYGLWEKLGVQQRGAEATEVLMVASKPL